MAEVIYMSTRNEHKPGNDNPSVVRFKKTRFTLQVGLINLNDMRNKLLLENVAAVLASTISEFEQSLSEIEKNITDNGGTI